MAHSKLHPGKGIFTCTGKGHNRIASRSKKGDLWSDGQVQCRNKFSFGQLIMFALRMQFRCTRDATYVSKILSTQTGMQFQMSQKNIYSCSKSVRDQYMYYVRRASAPRSFDEQKRSKSVHMKRLWTPFEHF
ncbi:hypothetical protein PV326_009126 [Microctonus aethiopoides]|nr:hypothetical protein PV326_009126 [Microctonus aethiopoides]